MKTPLFLCLIILAAVLAFGGQRASAHEDALRQALTLHASFDGRLTADFAKGDPALYTVTATKPEVKIEPGLKTDPALVEHQKAAGRFGDCLHFKSADAPRLFYAVEKNLPYEAADWDGTVSFWLRTSPDEDLAPGYTDPIQITPRSALDACFFFEFGIEDPRPCRLGVFPDRLAWNPENKPNAEIPIPARPLIEVQNPPFSRERWTHIVFTFEKFNNGDQQGVARLFLDGEPRGEMTGWKQQFTWDLAQAQIRLGVKYIGGLDELSCFDRALTAAEVKALHQLPKGVTALLAPPVVNVSALEDVSEYIWVGTVDPSFMLDGHLFAEFVKEFKVRHRSIGSTMMSIFVDREHAEATYCLLKVLSKDSRFGTARISQVFDNTYTIAKFKEESRAAADRLREQK